MNFKNVQFFIFFYTAFNVKAFFHFDFLKKLGPINYFLAHGLPCRGFNSIYEFFYCNKNPFLNEIPGKIPLVLLLMNETLRGKAKGKGSCKARRSLLKTSPVAG